jgi:hypothetical protein
MTHEVFQLGLSRYSYISKGQLLVGGEGISKVDFDRVSGVQLEYSLSQTVEDMLTNDLESIQRIQLETVCTSKIVQKDSYGSACLDVVKQAIHLTEDVPADREWLLNSLTDLLKQFSVRLQGNKPTGEEDVEDANRTTFSVGRNYRVNSVKRKGG